MFVLMFAAIGGGLATVSLLAPLGLVSAVLAAPLGGSLCAVLAAVHISRQRGPDWISQSELDTQTDDMVAALRSLAQTTDAPAQSHPEKTGSRAA